jgi:broad specificity phosphatase PhoE
VIAFLLTHSNNLPCDLLYISDVLHLEIYDEDFGGIADEYIGDTEVPYEKLLDGEYVTLNIYTKTKKKKKGNERPATITVRLALSKTFSEKKSSIRSSTFLTGHEDKKEIFIIRHGESKWNEAQRDKDVGGLLKQYDHELTTLGIQQASSFNSKWKEQQSTKHQKDDDITTFLNATKIFSSPLTRAIETALLTCEDHPALKTNGLTLLRNLREKKNIGSFDTVGQVSGNDIAPHVSKCLNDEFPDEKTKKLMVPIDFNDAVDEWWTRLEIAEKGFDIRARWEQLFNYIRYATPDDNILILVGHSHFFRALCQQYMSEEYREKDPAWTDELSKGKLDNASCLRCTLKWDHVGSDDLHHDLNPLPKLTKCKLVFGSKIVDGGGEKKTSKKSHGINSKDVILDAND